LVVPLFLARVGPVAVRGGRRPAVFTGLASQQISNDPGGNRWKRLVDPAVDLLTERPPAAHVI